MSPGEQNTAIAAVCGIKPRSEGWACVSPVDGGACYFAYSREQCQEWLDSLPEGTPWKNYVPLELMVLPNFCTDLNAMHEAERMLGEYGNRHWATYDSHLTKGDIALSGRISHAKAERRAEAFLRTLGKWEDEPS